MAQLPMSKHLVLKTLRWAGCLVIAVHLPACFVSRETGRLMQEDINVLKRDTSAMRRSLDAQKVAEAEHVQQTLKKLEELSLALQEFNQSARLTDSDFGSQVEHLIRDVQELRGAVEVNEHRIGETETKLQQTIAERIDALTKQNAAAQAEQSADRDLPKNRKDAMALAQRAKGEGRLQEARALWRSIVKTWPKLPGTTDEALYRLGDTYLDEKKYEAALREYIKVVDKFSKGRWVDDAYYKIAVCSAELGRWQDAQTFFQEVVASYPTSPWFKNAQSRLEEVNRKVAGAKSNGPK